MHVFSQYLPCLAQAFEVLEAMEKDSGVKLAALNVDGGMTANELMLQFQSDIANTLVSRPAILETTAVGAAYAAGLAVGFWKVSDVSGAHGLVVTSSSLTLTTEVYVSAGYCPVLRILKSCRRNGKWTNSGRPA